MIVDNPDTISTNESIGILTSPCGFVLGDSILFDTFNKWLLSIRPWATTDMNPAFYEAGAQLFPQVIHFEETNFVRPPNHAIVCSVADEVDLLAERGIYPAWTEFDLSVAEQYSDFAVVNLRNIKKAKPKNVDPITANFVLEYLSAKYSKVMIVGNDDKLTIEIDRPNVIDYRKKLSLPQIAGLCRYADIYCGSDSGIGHLAAAAGCARLVVWGLWQKKYAPKTSCLCNYLMRKDSSIQNIVRMINYTLEDKRGSD